MMAYDIEGEGGKGGFSGYIKDFLKVCRVGPVALQANAGIEMEEIQFLALPFHFLAECGPVFEVGNIENMSVDGAAALDALLGGVEGFLVVVHEVDVHGVGGT